MGRVAVFDREISFNFQCKGLGGLCQGGTATDKWRAHKRVLHHRLQVQIGFLTVKSKSWYIYCEVLKLTYLELYFMKRLNTLIANPFAQDPRGS